MSAATYTWDDAQIEAYRARVAPVRRNRWNDIGDWFSHPKSGSMRGATVAMGGAVAIGAIGYYFRGGDFANWATMGFLIMFLGMMGSYPIIRRRAIPQPQWKSLSLADFLDLEDEVIDAAHPLRKAVVEARQKYPEAEFTVEYLEPKSIDNPIRVLSLWMCESPFISTDEDVILVLEGTEVIVPAVDNTAT